MVDPLITDGGKIAPNAYQKMIERLLLFPPTPIPFSSKHTNISYHPLGPPASLEMALRRSLHKIIDIL